MLSVNCCRVSLLTACLAFVLWLGMPVAAYALGPVEAMAPGFSGYAAVMVGGTEKESNLDTEQSARVDSLSQTNTVDGRSLTIPAFELRYGLENTTTQFYLGTPAERILNLSYGLEIGLRQRFDDNKVLRLAYLPAVLDAERWADPYLVAESRQVTDQSSSGVLIGLDHPAFSVNFAQGVVKIDDELSGSEFDAVAQAALRRAGDYFALTANTGFPLKKGVMLLPGIVHIEADLEGEAMSHQLTTLSLGLMFKLQHSRVVLKIGGGERRYDADNPVFDQRQRDDVVNASILYLRGSSRVWGDPALTVLISHNESDSNINFLDESSFFAAAGLRWSF